ncbi:MAG TPA: hypothetical protein VMH35_06160 [Streptosporangiaceae bacterium]|nr:hypothetical protein [Streptosporangiaceae bacterium]
MSRFGRRGCDEEDVRVFCDQVGSELAVLLSEKNSLREEVNRLRKRMNGADGKGGLLTYRPEDGHVQAVQILSRAQQTADRYVADAQQYSHDLAKDARRHRDQVLAEAHSNAKRVLEEVHQRASQAATDALDGPDLPTVSKRQELQAELAYLRTYSDVYRTHLRAYLDALLRNVDEWEKAEKSSVALIRTERPPRPSELDL